VGVAKDVAEAVRWYRKAADQGYAAAQYDLGRAYDLGDGVAKDNVEAARWWQKAAEQGIAKAQYNLGLAYHSGAGVTKDDVEAYFWINIAASSLDQAFVRQSRDNIGKSLTAAQLSEVQERCRKRVEAHPNTQSSP
jgi:TPR repeat protein